MAKLREGNAQSFVYLSTTIRDKETSKEKLELKVSGHVDTREEIDELIAEFRETLFASYDTVVVPAPPADEATAPEEEAFA